MIVFTVLLETSSIYWIRQYHSMILHRFMQIFIVDIAFLMLYVIRIFEDPIIQFMTIRYVISELKYGANLYISFKLNLDTVNSNCTGVFKLKHYWFLTEKIL